MKHCLQWVLLALGCTFLVACGEEPQVADTKKADTRPWSSETSRYAADGWRPGDQNAWETQTRERARHQNEFVRMSK